MKNLSSILYFVTAALVVIMIGGLAGWYLFVNREINETRASDSARGFQSGSAFGESRSAGFETPLSGVAGESATTSTQAAKRAPRLWQVSEEAVAGFGFRATSSELLSVESASGNVFRANPETSEIARLTSTLYPRVAEAIVRSEGVVLRFLEGETVQTLVAMYATSTDPKESQVLKGTYIAPGILDINATPNRTLTYLIPDAAGSAIMQTDWKGAAPKKLFSSPLLDWNMQTAPDGAVVLVQKTTDGMAGYSFTLSGSILTPLESGIAGLTVAPRAGGARLYSSSDGTLRLFARISASAESTLLPIRTVADKCVWAPGNIPVAYCAVPQNIPSAQYLENRDQGAAHSIDAWYRIHAINGTADPLFTPDPGLALDVEQPVIDPSGSYIAFRNAADRSLWMLRIAQ